MNRSELDKMPIQWQDGYYSRANDQYSNPYDFMSQKASNSLWDEGFEYMSQEMMKRWDNKK